MNADASFPERLDALLDRIAPILAGQPLEMQGAVVNDLAALWIAAHRVRGDRAEGDRMREELLVLHAQHVRELVAMYVGDADG